MMNGKHDLTMFLTAAKSNAEQAQLPNGLARKSNHEDLEDRKEFEVVSLRSLRPSRLAF